MSGHGFSRNRLSAPLVQAIEFFETLNPGSVDRISTLYESNARFVDPFNDVHGHDAIKRIFDEMYEKLDTPSFVVTQAFDAAGDSSGHAFVTWEFHFRFKRFSRQREQLVRGSTHFVFSPSQHIALHHDYWDAAHQLYEKIPVLGVLMRWLR